MTDIRVQFYSSKCGLSVAGLSMTTEHTTIKQWNICSRFHFQIGCWVWRLVFKWRITCCQTYIGLLSAASSLTPNSNPRAIVRQIVPLCLNSIGTSNVLVTKLCSGRSVDQLCQATQFISVEVSLIRAVLMLFGFLAEDSGLFSLWARLVLIGLLQFVHLMSCCSSLPLFISANSNQLFPSNN